MTLPSRWPAILQAVMKGQPRALADSHYPQWHPAPVTGLMNDPNGFIWFAGRYHLFYQWNPLDCEHRFKCWGHWSSADLVHWQHEPLALMPDEEYDRNGCYSGSAVDNHGVLALCYTGNVNLMTAAARPGSASPWNSRTGPLRSWGPVLALRKATPDTCATRRCGSTTECGTWCSARRMCKARQGAAVYISRFARLGVLRGIAGSRGNGLTDAGYMWSVRTCSRSTERTS